jgi:hypothetical protein
VGIEKCAERVSQKVSQSDKLVPLLLEDCNAGVLADDSVLYGTREAQESGVNRAARILAGRDMLSGSAFAKFIGVSREAVRGKHQRHEVLGLKGGKRGLRFPKWQEISNSSLLPEFPKLSICLAVMRGLFIGSSLNPNSDIRNLPLGRNRCFE